MSADEASKAAATLGAMGGRVRSAAATESRRKNGARGGRPSARCLRAEDQIQRAIVALNAGDVPAALAILVDP